MIIKENEGWAQGKVVARYGTHERERHAHTESGGTLGMQSIPCCISGQ